MTFSCTQNNLNHHTKLELVSLSWQDFALGCYIKSALKHQICLLLSTSGRSSESMVGFGAEDHCALAAGWRCCREVTAGRSRTDAKSPAHSGVREGSPATGWISSIWLERVSGVSCAEAMLTYSPLHLCFRHPLAKAVLLLCKAVQLSLSPLKGEGAMSCLSHCDRASSYMSSSVAIPLTQSGNLLNKVL